MGIKEIQEAAERIDDSIIHTPLLTSDVIDERAGAELVFKPEGLQHGGSFKLRGAANAIQQISKPEGGVVAYSSGNHGKALAYMGHKLNIPVTLVLSNQVEAAKLEAVIHYGAEVVQYDPATQSRVEVANEIADRTGAELIPPYDDERVIAGQGTVALELLEQDPSLDMIVVPVGGGGLIAGCAIAAKEVKTEKAVEVIGAEPVTADDVKKSLETGEIVRIEDEDINTICAGLRTNSPGEIPFEYIKKYVDRVEVAGDDRVREAMRLIWDELKLVVEPAGALALACVFEHPDIFRGKRIGIVICGSNISIEDYMTAAKG